MGPSCGDGAGKEILRAEENIIPKSIGGHHEENSSSVAVFTIDFTSSLRRKNTKENDTINRSDDVPDPKRYCVMRLLQLRKIRFHILASAQIL